MQNIGLISYSAAAAGFLFLLVMLGVSWRRGALGAWLMVAAAMTAVWAVISAIESYQGGIETLARVAEVLRSAVWLCFLLRVMSFPWDIRRIGSLRDAVAPLVLTFVALIVAADTLPLRDMVGITVRVPVDLDFSARLALAVIGLLLVENLYRNTTPERRWNIKFLCVAVGGLFAWDFVIYSEALLYRQVNLDLIEARGLINAVVVPLLAVAAARNPSWSLDVFVSRRVIFHSSTLVAAGIYLLFMAAAGYFLRRYGGNWGPILQAVFIFATVVMLLLVVFSGRFRALLKVKINKHFFAYQYDYREEWLRLIRTLSSIGVSGGLPARIIQGVGDIVESPDGLLWLRQDGDRFVCEGEWNTSSWGEAARTKELLADSSLVTLLEEGEWVVNLLEHSARGERHGDVVLPQEIVQMRRAWLLVPLLHQEWLVGFLVLGRPRSPKELNWEDYDLLKTVGRQAASYLAEHQTARALAEARQFDEFNRRFAFVLHDIKNLVSQLSVMLSNAEKYKGNPEFYEDMVQTVTESVEKMRRLLVRLHEGGKEAKASSAIDLAPFLRQMVDRAAANGRDLSFDCRAEGMIVFADEDRFSAVMSHVLDNAIGATDHGGRIAVRLDAAGGNAVIEIEDNGTGMAPEFVRDEMFKPFRSTKNEGYGIGAFESREFVRELGGRFDVESEIGKGTAIRITLPAISGEKPSAAVELGMGA